METKQKRIVIALVSIIVLLGASFGVTTRSMNTVQDPKLTEEERIEIIYSQIAAIEKDNRVNRLQKDKLVSELNVVNSQIEVNQQQIDQLNQKVNEIRFSGLAYLGFQESSEAQ